MDTENTSWAHTLAGATAGHPGESGVEVLQYGFDALSARLALVDTAERCLDLQSYLWTPDVAGRLLAERVVRAADRGVHVRILLDDVGGTASDATLLALDAHTNIEVRLFNPVASRTFRKLTMLFEFQRINRRMHNKSFTADRLVTIVGGRNMEARYFAVGVQPWFADLDVLAAGPVATEVAAMFDSYWYSPCAIPIEALVGKRLPAEQLAESNASLAAHAKAVTNSSDFKHLETNAVGVAISHHAPALVWGQTWLVCDLPEKISADPVDPSTHLLPTLRGAVDATKSEIFVVSPYFVPGRKGVAFFRSLRERGVRVVVVSNSLASTDVTAVHVGYRRYRKALLRAGVEMWEIRSDAKVAAKFQDHDTAYKHGGRSRSALHAKALAFDRHTLFVGSLNLDPRSSSLNTEMGLVAEIPELAELAVDTLETRLAQSAYRLEFVPGPGPCKECGSIVWHRREKGQDVCYTHEPQASLSQRLSVFFLSFLPIESQL